MTGMMRLKLRQLRETWGSLFTQMTVYYFIVIAISLAILAGILFFFFSSTMKSDMLAYTNKLSNQTNMSLDNYFSEVVTSLEQVATNPLVLESLKAYEQSSNYTNYMNFQRIIAILQNIKSLKPDISDIFIYNPDFFIKPTLTKSVNVNSPFLQQVWDITLAHVSFMKPTFYPTHIPDYYNLSSQKQNIVSMSYPIRDIERYSSRTLAICMIDFNFERIAQIIEHTRLTEGDRIILMTPEGEVIYSTDASFASGSPISEDLQVQPVFTNDSGKYETRHEKEELLVTYSTSQVTGWKLIYLSKTTEIQKSVNQIYKVTGYLLLAIFVLTIVLSVTVSGTFARRMMHIINPMREAGRGDFTIRVPENSKHWEFRLLGNVFNMMMDKINALFREVYMVKIKQREAELKALESTIHPHFLNNTLQIIHSLAVLDRTRDIEQVTTALGNLLDYAIYDRENKVRISQELSYIEDYLSIQNIRHHYAITVVIDVEEQIREYPISKFLLQPLVENAVFHGLDNVEGDKLLRITGLKSDGTIQFFVEDNGIGMTKETLEQVLTRLEQAETKGTSIGLSNVQQRVKLEYGEQYGLSFDCAPDRGTTVQLVIPILDGR